MNIYFKLGVILLLFSLTKTFGQEEVSIGSKYTLSSKVLESNRELHVYLPASYSDSNTAYPVLYILDGQWFFTNGVAIQHSLRVPGMLPEMIVVGIQNSNPLRRSLFGSKREAFLTHLQTELIPFIEKKFRTSSERLLFGWEASAYFANFALLHPTQFFNGAILSDGAYASKEEVQAFDGLALKEDKYLYIANSKKDIYYVASSDGFAERLTEMQPKNLKWEYVLHNTEVHESLAHLAMYHGLRYYYHNYGSLVFSSMEEFETLGGFDYINAYYKGRGERFGFDPVPDNSVKNSLIWLAWNRDDYAHFTLFMDKFSSVLSTKRYASGYWQNRFGQYYLKHKNWKEAAAYFSNGLNKYAAAPQAETMHFGLAQAEFALGNSKLAKKHAQKAIVLAKTNNSSAIATYQEWIKSTL